MWMVWKRLEEVVVVVLVCWWILCVSPEGQHWEEASVAESL